MDGVDGVSMPISGEILKISMTAYVVIRQAGMGGEASREWRVRGGPRLRH